jgi:hypothetical protein
MKLKLIYAFLRFGSLPAGLFLFWMGWTLQLSPGWIAVPLTLVKLFILFLALLLTLTGAFVIQNVYFSRNHAQLTPNLSIETWPVTNDRLHNATVDMVWYRDAFYLAHVASLFHFGSERSTILVKRSPDGRNWEQVAEIGRGEDDVRDPTFAVIGEKLFLYVLLNKSTQPLPYTTRVTWTGDGENWSDLTNIGHEGWLFWRPKTRDGQTWYVPAYWHRFHKNTLFATRDGMNFEMVADISDGRFVNEPEIEFLGDDRMLATGRADYLKMSIHQIIGIPQTSTILSVAEPPYIEWKETGESLVTRLDGPVMFSHNGRVHAVGRAHPHNGAAFPRRGAVLSKKRTAIYEVQPDKLIHISDLPSCGDTSYPGIVVKDGYVYIAYYTNNIKKDYIWLLGMMEPTEIRIAKISLNDLERISNKNI